eukprot:TRINITY_DN17859_c0_g1_i1.p2 TRINITY_DN17859_c0_g1~~TRINITY_DN17859_c0_g1_i1.p2  ORF type:complete len:101 (+),score=10.33 TRINITY_DN17859_c0_g1_i1:333-635(+)
MRTNPTMASVVEVVMSLLLRLTMVVVASKVGHPLLATVPLPTPIDFTLVPAPNPPEIKDTNDDGVAAMAVSYTHLRAHETPEHLVCRLLLEKKKKITTQK